MTAQPVYLRFVYSTEWHRLTVVGVEHHTMGCLLAMPIDEPVLLSSDPPAGDVCPGCRRDLAARAATADVRPRTRISVADLVSGAWEAGR